MPPDLAEDLHGDRAADSAIDLASPGAGEDEFEEFAGDLGADLKGFYWFREDQRTVVGGNVTAVEDLGIDGVDMGAPPSPRGPPQLVTVAGPNGEPFIELQGTERVLIANVNYAAGHRVAFFVVAQCPPDNTGERAIVQCGHPAENLLYGRDGTGKFRRYSAFNGAGTQDLRPASGVATNLYTPWALHGYQPLATGARSTINGVNTTPNFTGSAAAPAWAYFCLGYMTFNVSGGRIACAMLVNNSQTWLARIQEFTTAIYGVG